MRLGLPLLFAATLWAADETRERSRELLEEAAELAGAATLEVHILAFQRLGEAYRDFDRAVSIEWVRRAFSATAGLPFESRITSQSRVAKAMAAVSPEAAAELLRAMADPGDESDDGRSAADRVVELLVAKGEFDRALEALNLLPEGVAYPFPAAQRLFEKLPENDSRRLIVFGRAHAAYRRKPQGPFPEFLARHWRNVPRETAQSALSSVLAALRDLEDQTEQSETLKGDQGTVRLESRKTIEFFRLAAALRQLAPKTLDDLLATHPDLRAALEKFPDGRTSGAWTDTSVATVDRRDGSGGQSATASAGGDEGTGISLAFGFAAPGRNMQEMMGHWSSAIPKAEAAIGLAATKPDQALETAREINLAGLRAETAASIAKIAAAKDAAAGRTAVNAAFSMLRDIDVPEDRIAAWAALAEACAKLRDEKAAWDALQRAVADSLEMLRHDTGADGRNRAPRAYWPSTQGCRLAMFRAAKLFGVRAATLLSDIDDQDLSLLARIDVGDALAGHELTSMRILVTR